MNSVIAAQVCVCVGGCAVRSVLCVMMVRCVGVGRSCWLLTAQMARLPEVRTILECLIHHRSFPACSCDAIMVDFTGFLGSFPSSLCPSVIHAQKKYKGTVHNFAVLILDCSFNSPSVGINNGNLPLKTSESQAVFGRFLLLTHFYSQWAHFLLQYKVLHLYGFRSTTARERGNLTMCPVQCNKVMML